MLRAQRLVCVNTSWAHRTFAEQIPGLTRRHARRTQSLTALLTDAPLRARQVCEAMDMEACSPSRGRSRPATPRPARLPPRNSETDISPRTALSVL
ncbi:hypothetical protein GCM10009574_090880 [Streptomyces asiaticus]